MTLATLTRAIASSVIAMLVVSSPCAAADLTEGPRLAAIYDTILAARFDEARQAIATACPPAPREACLTLGVVSRWWQILLDPENRASDAAFERAALEAVDAAQRWTEREPSRAESWFYLAGAYGPLVQWRVLRGERLTAAREGGRIKRALDRALVLDPGLTDAYFGLGLYRYYADVVPAAARLMRWLLFLPGGDRELGLRQMQEARARGQLLASEADFQLHYIYLWYEKQPPVALSLLAGLDRRYPSNHLFLQRIAEVQCEYQQNHAASITGWQELLDRAHSGKIEARALAITRARLGLAREFSETSRFDQAIVHLRAVIDDAPVAPFGVMARAYLALGRAHDRLGDSSAAERAYTSALQHVPSGDPDRIRDGVRDARRRRTTSTR